jgi:hypothetical protein
MEGNRVSGLIVQNDTVVEADIRILDELIRARADGIAD